VSCKPSSTTTIRPDHIKGLNNRCRFLGNKPLRQAQSGDERYWVSSAAPTADQTRPPSTQSEQSLRGISAPPAPEPASGTTCPCLGNPSCTSRLADSRRNAQDPSQKRARWTGFPRCWCAIPVPRTPLAVFFALNSTWMRFLHHPAGVAIMMCTEYNTLCQTTASSPRAAHETGLGLHRPPAGRHQRAAGEACGWIMCTA
jgi:hypothetical protein